MCLLLYLAGTKIIYILYGYIKKFHVIFKLMVSCLLEIRFSKNSILYLVANHIQSNLKKIPMVRGTMDHWNYFSYHTTIKGHDITKQVSYNNMIATSQALRAKLFSLLSSRSHTSAKAISRYGSGNSSRWRRLIHPPKKSLKLVAVVGSGAMVCGGITIYMFSGTIEIN